MSYVASVRCNFCNLTVPLPDDGGFPPGWLELNEKPSLRGPDQQVEKRRRLHACPTCLNQSIRPLMAEEPVDNAREPRK
jgi:hypothetical protein